MTLSLAIIRAGAEARLSSAAWAVYLLHATSAIEGRSALRRVVIARTIGYSTRQVRNAEAQLEAAGLLRFERNARGHRQVALRVAGIDLLLDALRDLTRAATEDDGKASSDHRKDLSGATDPASDLPLARPLEREDCIDGPRPCPWVSCRHHLWSAQAATAGSWGRRIDGPPPWEMEETCALDVAARGPQDLTEIGRLLGLSRHRIGQLEKAALQSLRESEAGAVVAEYLERNADDE